MADGFTRIHNIGVMSLQKKLSVESFYVEHMSPCGIYIPVSFNLDAINEELRYTCYVYNGCTEYFLKREKNDTNFLY